MRKKQSEKSLANLKPYTKGNKRAVGHGRPRLTPEQKLMCVQTRTKFKLLLVEYSTLDSDQIDELLKEKKLPALDMAVLKHLQEGIKSGSMERIDWFLNHVAGKPAEEINMNVTGDFQNSIDIKNLDKADLLALKAIAEKAQKKK